MSMTKRWLEEVSEDIGFGGEINNKVIKEANSRTAMMFDAIHDWDKEAELERTMSDYEKGVDNAK